MWQYCIIFMVLVVAIGYAGWRFHDAVREGGDPCRDCELKKKCKKFCDLKEK